MYIPCQPVQDSPSGLSSVHHMGGVPTPATPGVWAVSHRDFDRAQQGRGHPSNPSSSFELVTDVTFIWSLPATSAFVTGTFSNWETTAAMTLTSGPDGPIWVYSKALPPGEYQYKCSFLSRLSSSIPSSATFSTILARIPSIFETLTASLTLNIFFSNSVCE